MGAMIISSSLMYSIVTILLGVYDEVTMAAMMQHHRDLSIIYCSFPEKDNIIIQTT